MKPKIIFFSRSYQTILFPLLLSEKYDSIYVVLTKQEKEKLEEDGYKVEFCFETYQESVADIDENYLKTSLLSDRFLNNRRINERLYLLKKEIAFWRDVFDKYQPIAVINEIVAIEIAEVMYIEAKKRGIRYLAWMANPINGYFYWVSDPISLSLDNRILNTIPSKKTLEIAKKYIKAIIEKNEMPYYIIRFLNQRKIENLFRATKSLIKIYLRKIKKNNKSYEDATTAAKLFFERSFKAFFIKYDSLDDIKGFEIILYPLHYEPEASLLYLSEFFSNQVALVENLTKCLKLNQVLVVKEHPAQPGMLLTKKFQTLIKNNSQLFYLPAQITSHEIIKKASVVVTLTSHLGWEALILGKPVFLLGKMFYDKYPYINRFTSFEKLKDDIRNNNYLYPELEATIDYIAKILEHSYKGMPFQCKFLYNEDNIKNIIHAIETELEIE